MESKVKIAHELLVGPKGHEICVISVVGTLDYVTAPEMENLLQDILAERKFNIVIDLSQTKFISSSGWGVFIGFLKQTKLYEGDFKLVGLDGYLKDNFEMLKIGRFIASYETIENALDSFQGS